MRNDSNQETGLGVISRINHSVTTLPTRNFPPLRKVKQVLWWGEGYQWEEGRETERVKEGIIG
jgi:hypothetical protein